METNEGANGRSGDWVSAHDAIDMLLCIFGHGMGSTAAMSLAKRAHSGLVATRARLFKWQEETGRAFGGSQTVNREAKFAILPKEFWWAEGQAALTQDWFLGDFSTWIDKKFHWQAFGTEFARNDIEAMLPHGIVNRKTRANLAPASDLDQTAEESPTLPTDDAIRAKMLEMTKGGMRRDAAAVFIRQIKGFEAVGNEHARRAVNGSLPIGRPKKGA